ncbi:hypothetical protein CLAFUW4_14341 [Fulvia fulva]|uniref:Uncharacterized protein n=1 Tax=Passalora fulva TaxID=5499 RepID=A0A9Q8PLY4_PASFU|nr:uncharacterized protein CLAFUR5_14171 [Fulvia fulva]UJO24903.1 hypothetical protein CLAFUR5_14171 [Fulvia fulva]WPV22837.1 hypothetical protein CLAFUW4_14341 [Fulvia fulva]
MSPSCSDRTSQGNILTMSLAPAGRIYVGGIDDTAGEERRVTDHTGIPLAQGRRLGDLTIQPPFNQSTALANGDERDPNTMPDNESNSVAYEVSSAVETVQDATNDDATNISKAISMASKRQRDRCRSYSRDPSGPVNLMIYELRTAMGKSSGRDQIAGNANRRHKDSGRDGNTLDALACYNRFTYTAEQIARARSEPYEKEWYITPRGKKSHVAHNTGKRKRSGNTEELDRLVELDTAEHTSTDPSLALKKHRLNRRLGRSDPHNPGDPVNIKIYELRVALDETSGWPQIADIVNREHKGSGLKGQALSAALCYQRFTNTAQRITTRRSEPCLREWYIGPARGPPQGGAIQSLRERVGRPGTGEKGGSARSLSTSIEHVEAHNSFTKDNEAEHGTTEEDHDSTSSSRDDTASLINDPSSAKAATTDRANSVVDSRETITPLTLLPGLHTTTPDALWTDLANLYESLSTHLEAAKTICDHEKYDALRDHFDDEVQGLHYSLRRVQRILNSLPDKVYQV